MSDFSKSVRKALTAIPVAGFAAVLGGVPAAHAQQYIQTVYSDVGTAQSYYTQGGEATTNGVSATTMIADDITLTPGATGAITGFSFSMINANSVTASAEPIISFYDATGSGGGPGALLAAFNFGPISLGSFNYNVFTYNPGTTIFTTSPSKFWIGETFDNAGGATATAAQLNSFGEVIFNPVTVGSSTNNFFQSTNTGSAAYLASNPAGSPNFAFTGTNAPLANFGFAFTGVTSAPEPSAVVLALSGGLLTVGGIVRRRRTAK